MPVFEEMTDLSPRYLQLDELWRFCSKQQGKLSGKELLNSAMGDQYLFFAIDPETKVVPAWSLGKRTSETALDFLTKLRTTLDGPMPQISTDAWNGYENTIEEALGAVDYGTVIKNFVGQAAGRGRYAPPKVSAISKQVRSGDPDPAHISTSIIERSNWTVRTMQRRFTRLAAGFSRKLENLHAACALHFAYYNFCWQVRTLKKQTPPTTARNSSHPGVATAASNDAAIPSKNMTNLELSGIAPPQYAGRLRIAARRGRSYYTPFLGSENVASAFFSKTYHYPRSCMPE